MYISWYSGQYWCPGRVHSFTLNYIWKMFWNLLLKIYKTTICMITMQASSARVYSLNRDPDPINTGALNHFKFRFFGWIYCWFWTISTIVLVLFFSPVCLKLLVWKLRMDDQRAIVMCVLKSCKLRRTEIAGTLRITIKKSEKYTLVFCMFVNYSLKLFQLYPTSSSWSEKFCFCMGQECCTILV